MGNSKESYKIEIDRKFLHDIKRLDPRIRKRMKEFIDIIEENPLIIFNFDVKKLKGYTNTFRIRVGKYRLLFSIDKKRKVIILLRFLSREKAYK